MKKKTKRLSAIKLEQKVSTKTQLLLGVMMAAALVGAGLFAALTLELPKPSKYPIYNTPEVNISSYNNPTETHVRAGATAVTFGSIKLDAKYDTLDLDQMTLYVDDGNLMGTAQGDYRDVITVYIYDGYTLLGSSAIPSTGKYTFNFSDGTLWVPKDGSKTLTIKADLGTINPVHDNSPATPAADIRFGIGGKDGIQLTGKNSGKIAKERYNGATTSAMIINKTFPTVTYSNFQDTLGADTFLTAGRNNIFAFRVAADPGGEVLLYRTTFNIISGGSGDFSVEDCQLNDQDGNVVGSPYTELENGYISYVFDNPNISTSDYKEALQIPAGSSRTYTLNCNVDYPGPGDYVAVSMLGDLASSTPAASLGTPEYIGQNVADAWGTNSSGFILDNGNFVWSDNFKNRGLSTDGANATAYGQWYNGNLVPGMYIYGTVPNLPFYAIGYQS